MDQGPLVIEEIDAGADLVHRLDKSLPVSAAFWLKDSEDGSWYLYVASDQIDDQSIGPAYGEVLRAASEIASSDLDPFRVKLIPASDPLAQAALDIQRRFPGTMATRIGGTRFGGTSIEGAYLYPTSVTARTH
jgi:hypothetical protein